MSIDDAGFVDGAGAVVGEHLGGDVARERDGREAREIIDARERDRHVGAPEIIDGFLADCEQFDVEAVAADFALRRFGLAEQVRVVAAGQPAIGRDHHQQRSFLRALDRADRDSFRSEQRIGDARERFAVGQRVDERFLRTTQPRGGDQLQRARDLLRRFGRRDPPPDCLE